jgi:hypothetical protein
LNSAYQPSAEAVHTESNKPENDLLKNGHIKCRSSVINHVDDNIRSAPNEDANGAE